MIARHTAYGVMVLAVLVMIGCSALRVDVDVYKGALADEKEIQVERLAVMAIGAKPLIVDLRDQLENMERKAICKQYGAIITRESPDNLCADDAKMIFGRHKDKYVDGYMKMGNKTEMLHGESLVGTQAIRVNAILSLYNNTLGPELQGDIDSLKALQSRYAETHRVIVETHREWLQQRALPNANATLMDGLNDFFGKTYVKAGEDVYRATRLLKYCRLSNSSDVLMAITNSTAEDAFIESIADNTGKITNVLMQESLVDGGGEFYKRMSNRAKAIIESKIILRDMLSDSLQAYVSLHFAAQGISSTNMDSISRVLITMFTTLIDKDALDERGKIDLNVKIYEEPVKAGLRLLKLHRVSGNKYGLTRTTIFSANGGDELSDRREMERATTKLLAITDKSCFERGRLATGLEEMIEEYLEASESGEETAIKEKTQKLRNGLVRFAQKVLIIANFRVLLEGAESQNGIEGNAQVLQAIGNSIMVQANELTREEKHDEWVQNATFDFNALKDSYGIMSGKEVLADVIAHVSRLLAETNAKLASNLEKSNPSEKDIIDKNALNATAIRYNATINATKNQMQGWVEPEGGAQPEETFAALIVKLEGEADKEPFNGLVASNYTPVKLLPTYMLQEAQYADSRAVLDQLIAALSYRRLRAYQGGNEQLVATLTKTISAARGLRSNKSFLRPASAYLRTSYPATTLQNENVHGWRNMLSDSFFRSIPAFGAAKTEKQNRYYALLNELDKQSWQNVNTIRLNGAGRTNYVLAKDPVGNWTVKAYATNATVIANSALNLAKFSMSLPTNTITGTDGASLISKANRQSEMETLHDKYRKAYDAATKSQLEELKKVYGKDAVKGTIKGKWGENSALANANGTLNGTLEIPLNKLTPLENKPDSDLIWEGLDNLRVFYTELSGVLAGTQINNVDGQVCAGCNKTADSIAKAWVNSLLEGQLAKRKGVVKTYYDATMFIGEVVNPTTPESAAQTTKAVEASQSGQPAKTE